MYLYMLHEGEKLGASNRLGKKALIFCPKFSFLNKCLTILGSYSVRIHQTDFYHGTVRGNQFFISRTIFHGIIDCCLVPNIYRSWLLCSRRNIILLKNLI